MLAVALVGVLSTPASPTSFPDPQSRASAERGAAYLASVQGPDGSLPAGFSAHDTADATVALAAGGSVEALERAVAYLEANAAGDATTGPYTGKIVSGLVAAGRDPRAFAGTDFMAKLAGYHNPATGSYGGNLYGDALAMAAWLAGGEELGLGASTRLKRRQCPDGAWHFSGGCSEDGARDTDTTAMVLSVLAAADGPTAPEVSAGREWLLASQNDSGCWGANPAAEAASKDSANSCGLAISAVVALGEDPNAAPWAAGTRNPPAALRSLQQNSGAFHSQHGAPGGVTYATVQAIPALAGWSYPVDPPETAGDGPDDGRGHTPVGSGSSPSTTETTTAAGTAKDGSSHGGSSGGSTKTDEAGDERPAPTIPSRVAHADASTTTTTTNAAPGDSSPVGGETVASGRGDPRVTARLGGDSPRRRGRAAIVAEFSLGLLSSVTVISAWRWRRRWKRTALGLIPFGSPASKSDDP